VKTDAHTQILKFDDIPEAGLQLEESLAPSFLSEFLPKTQNFEAAAPGLASLFFQKQGQNVTVKGRAQSALTCECASCLSPVVLDLKPRIELVLFKKAAEVSLAQDDAEVSAFEDEKDNDADGDGVGEFDGKTIEWGSLVREHLLLALPIAPRCKESCKGLCPVCGINKNEAECTCVTKQTDPRWDKLKLLKLDGN
jgi:uncharacterized protein